MNKNMITIETIKKTIQTNLNEYFGVPLEEINDNSNLINDLGMDSLDCVELIMNLERDLNIVIPDDDAEETLAVGVLNIIDPTIATKNKKNNMNTQKVFNSNALTHAILFLIEKNGSTSSLEVKDFLRANGYWATQVDVSKAMNDIYDEMYNDGKVVKNNNGSYFVWTSLESSPVVDTDIYNSDIIDAFLDPSDNKPKFVSPEILSEDISNLTTKEIDILYPEESWVVFEKDFNGVIKVYSSKESRDYVRSNYARLTGIQIQDVRARRINNYINLAN